MCFKLVTHCHKFITRCYKLITLCYKLITLCYKLITLCSNTVSPHPNPSIATDFVTGLARSGTYCCEPPTELRQVHAIHVHYSCSTLPFNMTKGCRVLYDSTVALIHTAYAAQSMTRRCLGGGRQRFCIMLHVYAQCHWGVAEISVQEQEPVPLVVLNGGHCPCGAPCYEFAVLHAPESPATN